MPISPWVVSQVSPAWDIQLVRDNGSLLDLTGVTVPQLSLLIYNAAQVQIGVGAGTFSIVNTQGFIQYTPSPSDCTTAGTFYVRIKINFGGTTPNFTDLIPWTIQS